MRKNMRSAHFAEICKKYGNKQNMRQLHICIKLTCLEIRAVLLLKLSIAVNHLNNKLFLVCPNFSHVAIGQYVQYFLSAGWSLLEATVCAESVHDKDKPFIGFWQPWKAGLNKHTEKSCIHKIHKITLLEMI